MIFLWLDRALVLSGILLNLESLRRLHRKMDGRNDQQG